TRSRPCACGLEEGDDFAERRTGAEHDLDAGLLELGNVFLRNDPAARDEDVARLPFLEELHDLQEKGHVRPAEARQADRVDVLLDRGLDDVLRRLPQAGVDDLHAGVAQRAGDDLGPAVVAVESRFRDQDADLLRDRTASRMNGIVLSSDSHAFRRRSRAAVCFFESRVRRILLSRAVWALSDASETRRTSKSGCSSTTKSLTPTITRSRSSISRWYRYAEFAISCWK